MEPRSFRKFNTAPSPATAGPLVSISKARVLQSAVEIGLIMADEELAYKSSKSKLLHQKALIEEEFLIFIGLVI